MANKDHDSETGKFVSRYDTKEKRRALFDAYKEHRSKGFTKDSFVECDYKTIMAVVSNNATEFTEDEIGSIERGYQLFWEKIGIEGSQGVDAFNAPGWIFNMKNRFKWSDRNVISSETENPFELHLRLVE